MFGFKGSPLRCGAGLFCMELVSCVHNRYWVQLSVLYVIASENKKRRLTLTINHRVCFDIRLCLWLLLLLI